MTRYFIKAAVFNGRYEKKHECYVQASSYVAAIGKGAKLAKKALVPPRAKLESFKVEAFVVKKLRMAITKGVH